MKRLLTVLIIGMVAGPLCGLAVAGQDEWADFGKVAAGILGYQIIQDLRSDRPAPDPGWGTYRYSCKEPFDYRYRHDYRHRGPHPADRNRWEWEHRHREGPPAYSTGHWAVNEYGRGEYRSRWVPGTGYGYRSYGR